MVVCRVTNSEPIEIPNEQFTDIPLNTTDYASPGMHSDTVDNNRVLATEAGLYDVFGAGLFDAGGGTTRMLLVQKNGTAQGGPTIAVNSTPPCGNGNYTPMEVNGRGIPLLEGEWVNMIAYQDSGDALDIEGGSFQDFSPILYLVKVGELP